MSWFPQCDQCMVVADNAVAPGWTEAREDLDGFTFKLPSKREEGLGRLVIPSFPTIGRRGFGGDYVPPTEVQVNHIRHFCSRDCLLKWLDERLEGKSHLTSEAYREHVGMSAALPETLDSNRQNVTKKGEGE